MIPITVFTPTFNRAYTLHKCYESLKRQTCKDFIWLIVDDGSADNTKALVDAWRAEDCFEIRYFYQENQGMSAAHNTAYELIDTELNVCIDSDDYMSDDAIEKILAFWRRYGSKEVSGIVALNATPEGRVIGTELPSNMKACTLNDLYLKHRCKGDKKLIYRTELTRKHPYPRFQGEKLIPLNYKYALLDTEYKLLLMNEVVCHVEYMSDGSSRNIIRQYRVNPHGFSLYRKVYINISKNFLFRFRQMTHYVATSLIAGNRAFIRESPLKFMTLLAVVPGLMLYFFIMNTRRSGFITPRFKGNVPKQNEAVRVLQITGGMNIGGAETMLMHLYRKIDKSKIQFDFISFTEAECYYDAKIRASGGSIFHIAPPRESNLLEFLSDIRGVIKHNGPYHAVHAHTLFNSGLVLLAARMAGVKVRVCHSHALGYFNHTQKRSIYFALMRNLIRLSANRNVACSKAAGRFLFGSGRGEERFRLLNNALDLAPYASVSQRDADDMRRSLGIGPNTLVIGHVGNFGEHKNHAFLIRLAEFLRNKGVDYRLILIGRGGLQEQIRSMANGKGLNEQVIFLGLQTNIPLFMHMFDVFVFPSLHEGLGIVLIEAQAAGTPCVISDTIPEECDMGLGLIRALSLTDKLESWCEAILDSSKADRVPPQTAALKIRQKGYDLDATVKTLVDIYSLK